MLNLTIHTTRRVSSGDLRLAIEPPLMFEVRGYIAFETNMRLAEWQNAGRSNAAEAAELISLLFVSVSQDGNVYRLDSREAVEALRETIEAQSPGEGDAFIIAMLYGFTVSHFNFFSSGRNGSAISSTERITTAESAATP